MSVYLKELKANIALVKTIDENIATLKELAEDMQHYKPDIGMTVRYDREKVQSSSITSPVEIAAMYDPTKDVAEIFAEIRSLMIRRQRVMFRIDVAKTALNFLSDRERIIVELREFQEMTWENIAFEYEDQTGHSISDKTCNKVYWKAIRRIEPFFQYRQIDTEASIPPMTDTQQDKGL